MQTFLQIFPPIQKIAKQYPVKQITIMKLNYRHTSIGTNCLAFCIVKTGKINIHCKYSISEMQEIQIEMILFSSCFFFEFTYFYYYFHLHKMVSMVEDTIDTFSYYGRLGLDFITVSTITATTISRCSTNSVLPTPN